MAKQLTQTSASSFLQRRLPAIIWLVAAAALLLVLGGGRGSLGAAAKTTVVTCVPVSAVGQPGRPQAVDIYIRDVVGLFGADVRLGFDPGEVQVIDADAAAAGVQISPVDAFLSPDFVVRRTADNAAGTVWYAATQVTPSQPVTGSGPLARIDFRADRPLTTAITVTLSQLVDRDGRDIAHSSHGCQVTFEEMEQLGRTLFPMIVGSGRRWDFETFAPVIMR